MNKPLAKINLKQAEHNKRLQEILDRYKDRLPPETIRQALKYSECDPMLLKAELEWAVKEKEGKK